MPAARCAQIRDLRVQRQVNAAFLVRSHAVYEYIVRIISKHFPCIMYIIIIIGYCRKSGPQVKLPHVIFRLLRRLVKIDVHLREILVISQGGPVIRKDLHIPALCRSVSRGRPAVKLIEQKVNIGSHCSAPVSVYISIGIALRIPGIILSALCVVCSSRAAGPERLLIELDPLCLRTPEYHGPHMPVSQRKRPALPVVPLTGSLVSG